MSGRLLVLHSQQRTAQDQELMARAQNLALDATDKVLQQIQEGVLEINHRKIEYNINGNGKEEQLKRMKSKSVPHLYFPVPEYTSQDQLKVREMIRKQKQYEQKLEKSARQLEDKVRMDQDWQKQKIQQERKQKFQEKKQQVIQSLEQIKERHQNRKKLNVEENNQLNYIKAQKKLHQLLAEKWKKVQQQQLQQKQKIKQRLKEQKRVSFDEIRQFTARHDETMTKFRQSRIAQSRISQPEIKKFYQSVFMSRIVEQEQERKQDYDAKKNMAKQFAQKKQQYANIVRQNYKPRVKQTENPVTASQIRASKSLSHIETFHKGNDYMKEVNSRLGLRATGEGKLLSDQDRDKRESFKYKNYLTEIRIKKSEQEKQMQIGQKISRSNIYEKEIKKIMREPKLSQQQKFLQAKLVAKRMENIPKKNPFKLIDSINAKIEILKHISG